MKIQQGDIFLKVKIRKYYGQNNIKFIILNGKIEAIGYEENTDEKNDL